MNPIKEYPARWSGLLWGVSLFGSVILLGMPVLLAVSRVQQGIVAVAALSWLIWGGCLLFLVRGYRLEKRQLVIRRLLWETRIDLSDLQTAETIPAEAVRFSVRVFGNGGLFSFSGWYWNKQLGRYRMWATNMDNLVLLQCVGRKLVVSPDEPKKFVETVQSASGNL